MGSFEIYRKFDNTSSLIIERTTVHVSDDTGRIAMLEKRTYGSAGEDNDTAEELVRYIYSNHLQSATLELDEDAEIISYEEYHPYGTTSYQAMNADVHAVAKRYRYTGKERDEESGFYYHGARYYMPWLGRWLSPDPINSENYNLAKGYGLEKNLERDFLELCASPYEYSYDNPIIYSDPSGEQPPVKEAIPTKKIPAPWELTRNLPKGGELPNKDFAKELQDLVRKLPKQTPILKPVVSPTPKSPVPLRPNPLIMLVHLLTLSTPAHAPAPTNSFDLYHKEEVQPTPAPFKKMEDKEKYLEKEREKDDNIIYRTMQTINGEWIKSPLTGAGNARQLGARVGVGNDITPTIDGMVGPVKDIDGRYKGLSASPSLSNMEAKLFGLDGRDEYKNKEGAVGMFDKRLLPEGLSARKDDDKHVTIYPNRTMTVEEYTTKLNSIQWVPVTTKSK